MTIGNPGSASSALALEVGTESETPGTGGGRLWERMRIIVATEGGALVYQGGVADMGQLALGTLAGESERTYTLTAWIASREDDNAYQGAKLSLRFTWLSEAQVAPAPTTTPPNPDPPVEAVAPPTPAATPVAPNTAAPDPNATVTADQLFALPSAKTCLSRRQITIRIRAPRGVKVKSATVSINGRKRTTTKKSRALVNLRGLPRGTVRVQVRATLSSGRKLTIKRTYRTCTAGTKKKT